MMTEFVSMRLELLALCYRHDKPEDEIISRACKLENYVLSSAPTGDSASESTDVSKKRTEKVKTPV